MVGLKPLPTFDLDCGAPFTHALGSWLSSDASSRCVSCLSHRYLSYWLPSRPSRMIDSNHDHCDDCVVLYLLSCLNTWSVSSLTKWLRCFFFLKAEERYGHVYNGAYEVPKWTLTLEEKGEVIRKDHWVQPIVATKRLLPPMLPWIMTFCHWFTAYCSYCSHFPFCPCFKVQHRKGKANVFRLSQSHLFQPG